MPTKRRRLDWECHFKENDTVIYQSSGKYYIGKVVGVKLRQFGNNYNRIVVLIQPNYVSCSAFGHIYNRSGSYSQFYLLPMTGVNGKIFTEPKHDDRVWTLTENSPLFKWRSNIKKYQEIWFRSGYEKRHRLKCVVVDVQEDTISIQPKFSKLISVVNKKSEQIQPVITTTTSPPSTIIHFDVTFDTNYAIQTSMCSSMDQKNKYLGAWCELKSRQNVEYGLKTGFIVDVDYGVSDGKDLYCYVEDSGASEFIPHHRFDSHMTYVQWVTEDDITILGLPKNKMSQRKDVEIDNRVLKIKYKHGLVTRDVENLEKLKENDLELMFYYILRHAKSAGDNYIMFAIAYSLWCNNSYRIRPMYSHYRDDYEFTGLKRILLAQQDYFQQSNNNNSVQLQKIQQRLNNLLQPCRTHMAQVLEAEESYRNVPMFKFTPLSITKTGVDNEFFELEIDVSINNIHTLDMVTYPGTSISFNATALRPIMQRLLNVRYNRSETHTDIFDMPFYGRRNVSIMKRDQVNYMALNKITSLNKYQSWLVTRMVNEENSEKSLSHIFTKRLTDDLQYNMIAGFQERENTTSNGGILALNVGWGKTIIMLELIMRQGGSTLVCAPLTLIDQWKTEIKKFAPTLTVCEYYGRQRKQDADVVFTTYGTLRQVISELKEFDRVVFDESHLIKNAFSQRAVACFNVKAKKRWCVSATPYNDNNQQFQTQLRMLNIKPFEMNLHLLNNSPIFLPMFKRIMFSLDEKKLKRIGIVPIRTKVKQTKIVHVDADDNLKLLLKAIKNNVEANSSFISVLKPSATRSQIACTDPSLFPLAAFSKRSVNDNQEVTREQLIQSLDNRSNISQEYKKSFIEKLRTENDGTCCICLCEYEEPTITPCLHIYCNNCIKESLKRTTRCPQCRQEITVGSLKKMVTTHVEDKSVGNIHHFTDVLGDSWTVPIEVKRAYNQAKEKIPKKFEYIKKFVTETDQSCVIFSQYSLPLERLKKYLDRENIKNGLISGKTSRKKRGTLIQDFANGTLKTFLLSTKTAAVGINLQKGSTIIFLEPVISLADHTQSIGRLYRIGQEDDIDVIQLSTKGTYEETMCKELKYYKREQKEINRTCKGREKIQKQSQLKRKIFQHILS